VYVYCVAEREKQASLEGIHEKDEYKINKRKSQEGENTT
jgi:hypothetical protein